MLHTGRMTPEEREAHRRGREAFEAGEDEAALGALGRLLETRPGWADVHYMVGLVHERRGALDAAAESLERALEINPGYAEALAAFSSVQERRGHFEASRAAAERAAPALAERSGAPDATTRAKLANLQAALGDAYREAGEPREAVEAYRKALDRCPRFFDVRHRLGVALREAGLPSRALAEHRRVLRAKPGYLEAAVQLGLTLWTLGRAEEALESWRRVLARDSDRDDARMYLRMVEGKQER